MDCQKCAVCTSDARNGPVSLSRKVAALTLHTPTAATILRSLPRQYETWTLSVGCGTCRVVRLVPAARLARGDEEIGQALARLRCRTCGAAPGWVKIADGMPGTARQVREVALRGAEKS